MTEYFVIAFQAVTKAAIAGGGVPTTTGVGVAATAGGGVPAAGGAAVCAAAPKLIGNASAKTTNVSHEQRLAKRLMGITLRAAFTGAWRQAIAAHPAKACLEGMSMHRIFDHVDIRVRDLAASRPFYDAVLVAIGLPESGVDDAGLLVYYRRVDGRVAEAVSLIEDFGHQPSATRVAFGAASADDVDRIAAVASAAGASHIEGPLPSPEYSPTYYAAFISDPEGNQLEVVYR